jgi:hypothetical protein
MEYKFLYLLSHITSSQVRDWSNSSLTYSLIPEPDSDFTPVALMPSKFARLKRKIALQSSKGCNDIWWPMVKQ